MARTSHENLRISEEAALWLLRLQREDTPAVRAEFSAWIRKGATHLQEFLFAQAVWREFDHIDPAVIAGLDQPTASDDSSVVNLVTARPTAGPSSASADGPDNVPALAAAAVNTPPTSSDTCASPYRGATPGRYGSSTRRWSIGLAAGVTALAIAWVALTIHSIGTRTYATNLGDQKAIKLEDGSVVLLNTGSKVQVHYSDSERSIELLEGEALFTVEKDAARPFIVTTDNAQVRAVGTQFSVYRNRLDTTQVAVLNGIVQVTQAATLQRNPDHPSHDADSVRLVAGDVARIDGQGRIARETTPNAQRAIAWRERRLIFPGNSIADIADEFNRYNRIPIHVSGDTIRERRMSGVFDADDPAPLIQFLARDPEVEILTSDTEIMVRPRHRPLSGEPATAADNLRH